MAMNRVTRGEKLLQRLVDQEKLTAKGRDWLIASIDPMHDTQLVNLAGWPDVADQPSVVRCIKKSVTITKPAGVTTPTWDFLVQTMPILNERTVSRGTHTNNVFTAINTEFSTHLGALMYSGFNSDATSWGIDTLALDQQGANIISLDYTVAEGNGRLIGMGFEVNNVTAEIYKQGTVHVYRLPQQAETYPTFLSKRTTTVRDAAGTGTTNVDSYDAWTGRQVCGYPENQAKVTLLPGTRTWKASDGCYLVVPFEGAENPITPAQFVNPILVDAFYNNASGGLDASTSYVPANAEGITACQFGNKWSPCHSTGAAFTGLSSETSLNLQVNMYYEYFPNADDTGLITLAKPSATFDPFALSLYGEALGSMPVGVPASMNGFGDWFAGVVSKFAPAVGAALTPIFGPAAMGVGAAARGIADSYLAANTPLNKPRGIAPRPVSQPRLVTAPKAPPRGSSLPNNGKGKQIPKKKKKKRKILYM